MLVRVYHILHRGALAYRRACGVGSVAFCAEVTGFAAANFEISIPISKSSEISISYIKYIFVPDTWR